MVVVNLSTFFPFFRQCNSMYLKLPFTMGKLRQLAFTKGTYTLYACFTRQHLWKKRSHKYIIKNKHVYRESRHFICYYTGSWRLSFFVGSCSMRLAHTTTTAANSCTTTWKRNRRGEKIKGAIKHLWRGSICSTR